MVEGLGVIVGVEWGIGRPVARLDQPVGGDRFVVDVIALGRGVAGVFFHRRRLGRIFLGGFEQRVLLQLLAEHRFHFEVRQCQQPDRLLELRRHHQRLALDRRSRRGS